jgi:CRISPR system Cascade subunit CasC
MTTFIQIHTLQTFPVCNLNRGDDGRPKTVIYGGVERIRYSSQALKYALRNGPALRAELGDVFGKRTKLLGYEISDRLKKEKVPAEKADQIGAHVTEVFSKIDNKDPTGLKSTTLYFVGPDEEEAVYKLARKEAAGTTVEWDPQSILKNVTTAVDIGMFGRFYTDESSKPSDDQSKDREKNGQKQKPAKAGSAGRKVKLAKAKSADRKVSHKVEEGQADDVEQARKAKRRHAIIEAAVHVAHSFTTHRSSPEDDYFSASDDLGRGEVAGASHIDTQFFGSGVFYTYITVNRDHLEKNLNGNKELAQRCIEALVRTLPSTSPAGKRSSFASHGQSQFALVEIGKQQPRSLAAAFCEPVRSMDGRGLDRLSAERLLEQREAFEKVYGPMADRFGLFQAFAGKVEGSLDELVKIVRG